MQTEIAQAFPLDSIERLGKRYYEQTGRYLEYEKYFYLLKHGNRFPAMQTLLSDAALREQRELKAQFHENYYGQGYLDARFLDEGCILSMERLPRYVTLPAHSHDFLEFACVLDGECRHIVDGSEFRQETGSVAYVTPMTKHELVAIDGCVCLTFKLRANALEELNVPNITDYATPVMFRCGSDPFVLQMLLALWKQQQAHLPFQNRLSALMLEALLIYIHQSHRESMQRMCFGAYDRRMIALLDYIILNYQTVTLRTMAEQFHYSEAYLSKLFHRQTGSTFSQLLRNYKLDQAARLLREGNKKLGDICAEVGYEDTAQFIHNFKARFQTTPGQYRKRVRQG